MLKTVAVTARDTAEYRYRIVARKRLKIVV